MTFRQGWEHYWFEAEAPDNLGICRILFFASLCLSSIGARTSARGAM
jgi:hypothetical protein